MKKLLSFFAAIILIASSVAAVPVGAVEGLPVCEVDVPYFDVKPTVDGIVSEAEWGEATVAVSQAEVGNSKAIVNEDTPTANELNTFFYRDPSGAYDASNLTMSYKLWMRWDENYFYIAAKVADPDGHSLKHGQNETWNGDSLQVRVDPYGHNSGSMLGADRFDAEYDSHWESESIDDMCFGFVQLGTGFTEAWNNFDLPSHGGTGTGKGMTAISGGDCKAAVVPAGALYSSDSANGITTYEIAVPWHYIDGGKNTYNYKDYLKDKTGGIGRELGMSAVVYNADGNSGGASYNAGLAWGSGIIEKQYKDYPATCGGSNKLTLSADKVSDDGFYSPSYEKNENGYVPPQPVYNYPTFIDKNHYLKLDYEDESDMDCLGYYREGEWITEPGNPGNHVVRWDLDEENPGDEGADFYGAGLNSVNYLSTGTEEANKPFYNTVDCSYTMEFDVMVTGLKGFQKGYESALYNWFGGAEQIGNECGYNFNTGKFYIKNTLSGTEYASVAGDFTLNEWHHVVFQYYRPACEVRYYFDPEMAGGRIAPNQQPTLILQYAYLDMPGLSDCEIILRRMNCQIMLDNVEYYNFVDYMNPITEDADFDVVVRDDGAYAVCVKNAQKYRDQSPVNFTVDITKIAENFEYAGSENAVAGLASPVVDNGRVFIEVTDGGSAFSSVPDGGYLIEVLFRQKSGEKLSGEQFKNGVTVKAVYPKTVITPKRTTDGGSGGGGSYVPGVAAQTGDTELLLIGCAIPAAAILAFCAVYHVKRRRRIDF